MHGPKPSHYKAFYDHYRPPLRSSSTSSSGSGSSDSDSNARTGTNSGVTLNSVDPSAAAGVGVGKGAGPGASATGAQDAYARVPEQFQAVLEQFGRSARARPGIIQCLREYDMWLSLVD